MSSVTDHRGTPVRLYGLLTDRPRELDDGVIPIDIQTAIDRDARAAVDLADRGPPARLAAVQGVFVVGVLLTVHLAFGLPGSLWGIAMIVAAAWGVISLITLPLRRFLYMGREAAPILAAFLKHGRCPACGYDLAGCESDVEGFTVCPECAAAWQRDQSPER